MEKYNFDTYELNEVRIIKCPVFVGDKDRKYYQASKVHTVRMSAQQFNKRSDKKIKVSFRKPWEKIIVRRVK